MDKSKRILIVLENTGRGGAETQALLLSGGLIAKGFDVHVVSFGTEKGAYWPNFEKSGAKLHQTKFNAKLLLPPFETIKSRLIYLKYSCQFIRIIRKINPAVILPFTYPPNIIGTRLWKWTNVKACYWNQRDEGRLFDGNAWQIKALENCSGIISNSKEGALFLEQYTSQTITIIHNGVILPKTNRATPNSEKISVVMIANLHGYKDHLTLLKAWKLVMQAEEKMPLELLLAGKNGDTATVISQFIQENQLENSVQYLGVVTDVPKLLASCTIGVFSSTKEGLPNGILECMAVGLPVVATRIDGAEEALGENCSFLAEPYNAPALAEMLLQLIRNPDLRKKAGNQNLERIQKMFAVDKMINHYISVLKM